MLLLIFSVCTLTAKAQQTELAPLGAEWHYNYHTSWTGLVGYYNPRCIQDTILSGKPCKRLKITINTNAGSQFAFWYIHQKADSIFRSTQIAANQYEFTFLFRNNFQLGETTRMGNSLSIWEYQVVAIDSLLFNNQLVRCFVLQEEGSSYTTVIYDRFGPERGFFGNWCGIPCDENYFGLRCYEAPDFPLVNVSDEACEQIGVTGTQSPAAGILSLYPNPAHNSLHLSLPEKSGAPTDLHIADLSGRMVRTQPWPIASPEAEVNVAGLPAGAYLIWVQCDKIVYRSRFVRD